VRPRISSAIRSAIAMLCMVLAVMLSCQTYIGLMDRLDHAHNIVHFPNPLAGDVEYCSGDLGLCTDDSSTHHNPLMHHHGDAAIMFLNPQYFVLPDCTTFELRCVIITAAFSSVRPLGPDHPPKPLPETRA
jgi:hypothetical protein